MQDIVYKLVPGLQEGKLWYDIFLEAFLHIFLLTLWEKKKKREFQVMNGGGTEKKSIEISIRLCCLTLPGELCI